MKKNGEKGFTLIELIVVMGVIAILAVLLAPNVAEVLDQAALTAALSDARAIKTAMDMYFSDQRPRQYPASIGNYYPDLVNTLSPYLALPSDPNKASFTFSSYARGSNKKSFTMDIKAKDAAETPITIKQTGVTY